MPFHFCMDEVWMIMAMIPFIGIFFRKIHTWWHNKFTHQCHHVTQCEETHLEHTLISKGDVVPPAPSSSKETLYYPKYLTKEDIDVRREEILKYDFGTDEEDHEHEK